MRGLQVQFYSVNYVKIYTAKIWKIFRYNPNNIYQVSLILESLISEM